MTPGAGLSTDQAPPLAVPMRFYLGAPLFAASAGVLLAVSGDWSLTSRWMPPALAAVHLVALGALAQVMAGSLFQMLPVVAGAPVPRAGAVAMVTHVGLVVGAVLLPWAFLTRAPWAMHGAMGALGVAVAVLVVACGAALLRARAAWATVGSIALALASLAAAASLGVALAPLHVGGGSWVVGLRHLHPAWALAGWVGVLVVGVAFQVVPMFQLTRQYPKAVQRAWAPALVATLGVASFARDARVAAGCAVLVAVWFALFAGVTLALQHRRKRRTFDASLWLWRVGLAGLVASSMAFAARPLLPTYAQPRAEVFAAVAFLVGFAWSVVLAMLGKIVPFLCWFHLQARFLGRGRVPHMGTFLAERDLRRLLGAHAVALVLVGVALAWRPLHRVAWGAFTAEALLLQWLLARAAWRYRATAARLSLAHADVAGEAGVREGGDRRP